MRGDSLRDLYAKGLALLGLGLLAGAGALVDYWPASIEIPRVARGGDLARPALARIPRAGTATPLKFATLTPTSGSSLRAASSGVPAAFPARTRAANPLSATRPVFAVPVSASGLPLEGGVMLQAVAIAMPLGVEPISTVASIGTEVPLSSPALMTSSAVGEESAELSAPVSHDVDDDGFLTGAMKKTGTSIIRTGVKTGTSIRDAMRAIGGAVRRAFPG